MSWEWIAIVFGILIVLTRLPLVLRPPQALTLYRGMWATDGRARALGCLYLAIALACLGAAVDTSGLVTDLLLALAGVCLAAAVWALAAPSHFRDVADRVFHFVEESIGTAAIRALGAIGVSVGALLITIGVRAL